MQRVEVEDALNAEHGLEEQGQHQAATSVLAHTAEAGGRDAVEPHGLLHQRESSSVGGGPDKRGVSTTEACFKQPRP